MNALGLYVVPDDADGSWFRYQRLFGEMLRAELRRREPGEDGRILREASLWYEAHDLPGAGDRVRGGGLGRVLAEQPDRDARLRDDERGAGPAPCAPRWTAWTSTPWRPTRRWRWRRRGSRGLTGDAAQARRALRIAEGSEFDGNA